MEKEEKEKILWDCIENRAGERAKDFSFPIDIFNGILDAMEQYANLKMKENENG